MQEKEEVAVEDQQQRYEWARVQAIKGFYVHATVFVLVNIGLCSSSTPLRVDSRAECGGFTGR